MAEGMDEAMRAVLDTDLSTTDSPAVGQRPRPQPPSKSQSACSVEQMGNVEEEERGRTCSGPAQGQGARRPGPLPPPTRGSSRGRIIRGRGRGMRGRGRGGADTNARLAARAFSPPPPPLAPVAGPRAAPGGVALPGIASPSGMRSPPGERGEPEPAAASGGGSEPIPVKRDDNACDELASSAPRSVVNVSPNRPERPERDPVPTGVSPARKRPVGGSRRGPNSVMAGSSPAPGSLTGDASFPGVRLHVVDKEGADVAAVHTSHNSRVGHKRNMSADSRASTNFGALRLSGILGGGGSGESKGGAPPKSPPSGSKVSPALHPTRQGHADSHGDLGTDLSEIAFDGQNTDDDDEEEEEIVAGTPESGSTDAEAAGVKLFNANPKKGIRMLIEHEYVRDTPESVAAFLHECRDLDKNAIGEYVGERDDFILRVLHCFIDRLDFSQDSFEKALRRVLFCFRLPGESQKIERIMETFAEIYCAQSPKTLFKDSDTVFVLAYSTIMLNTDLHNPQVKNKMTPEQFVSNNRGINQGEDLPPEFLHELYHSILEVEIKMEGDDSFPHALKKGSLVVETKQVLGKAKRSKRWFVLDDDLSLYEFKSAKEEGGAPLASLSLKQGVTVERKVLDDDEKKREYIFTLYETITPDDTSAAVINGALRLIAGSQHSYDEWLKVISESTRCIITNRQPTVGLCVEEHDHGIGLAYTRAKESGANLGFLQRSMQNISSQMLLMSKNYGDIANQLQDFERRVETRNQRSDVPECLRLCCKTLTRVRKFTLELDSELASSVQQPLLDLVNGEIAAGKDQVRIFVESIKRQEDSQDKLHREIQAISNAKKPNQERFQKLFSESQRLEKSLELEKDLTREMLDDINLECEQQIIETLYGLIKIYHTYFSAGAEYLNELMPLVESRNREAALSFGTNGTDVPEKETDGGEGGTDGGEGGTAARPVPPPKPAPTKKTVRTGKLEKRGGKRREYSSFYFSLKRKYLYYFDSYAKNLDFKGAILLRNCSVLPISCKKSNEFVLCTETANIFFSAENAFVCNEWVEDIRKCVVNDTDYTPRDTIDVADEVDEVAENFRRQREIIQSQKKNAKLRMAQTLGEKHGEEGGMGLSDPDIIKQGMLLKRGEKVKNWTNRWFVLKQNVMNYYEVQSGDLKLKGTIHLLQSSIGHSERELKPHCFEIQQPHRIYYICAKDARDEHEWIEAILRSTATTSKTVPTASGFSRQSTRPADPKAARSSEPSQLSEESGRSQVDEERSENNTPVAAPRSPHPGQMSDMDFKRTASTIFTRQKGSGEGSVDGEEKLVGEKLKTGYLIKKGAVRKNWTNRYFVLRSDSLAYYKSPHEAPKGIIWLDSTSRLVNLNSKKPFSFSVTQAQSSREYWLAASDARDHQSWMEAIKSVVDERKSEITAPLEGQTPE